MTKFEISRANYNTDAARYHNVEFLTSIGVPLILGDIRFKDDLLKAVSGCDYIINCAAQPAMTIALEDPLYDAENNIIGVINILQVGKELKIPVALCSTIHVYGNGGNPFFEAAIQGKRTFNESEELLTGKITPLHVSKYVNELYARAFIESYQSKVFVARLTGIYGERQTGGEDHGFTANFCIRTWLGLPIKVFGTDRQIRDILYVKDAAQAFLDWFEHSQNPGIYNIGGGSGCAISLKDILLMLSDITRKKQNIIMEPARTGDLWYFVSDYSKAKQTFGWGPKTAVASGLLYLTQWVQDNESLFKG